MKSLNVVPSFGEIKAARKEIASFIVETPVISNREINELTGAEVFFKCENLQNTGSFKIRGAARTILSLSKEEQKKGVVARSSGNHAQAVAYVARELGIEAEIVMPDIATPFKVESTKKLGAKVLRTTQEGMDAGVEQIIKERGRIFVHPYNNYNLIAGQSTITQELLEHCKNLDIIMTPVGGGGLLSGTLLAVKYIQPSVKVIAGEPELVNDAYLSLQKGEMVLNTRTDTIADGLRTNMGDKTFPIIKEHVKAIITVSEQEIINATKYLWQHLHLVVEPSSAVPFAALLKQKEQFKGKKIGIILSGGNVAINDLSF